MISKKTIKLVKSLSIKKYRQKENLFLVEGDKMVGEVLYSGIEIKELLITEAFEKSEITDDNTIEKINEITKSELKKISLLKSPQNSLAICRIPKAQSIPNQLEDNLSVYLDSIQDPGNLGTIIRICDWFGITQIFCSKDTVDVYNPKVIQASMGSFYRVSICSCDFTEIQKLAQKDNISIYGAFMEGTNVYAKQLPNKAVLVMGNEGNGISAEIAKDINEKISIPNFSTNTQKAESLNVSVATAILCSEFKRR